MPRYSLAPHRTNTGTIDGRAVLNAIRADLEAEGQIELIDWLDENNLRLRSFVVGEIERQRGMRRAPTAASSYRAEQIAQLRNTINEFVRELAE